MTKNNNTGYNRILKIIYQYKSHIGMSYTIEITQNSYYGIVTESI